MVRSRPAERLRFTFFDKKLLIYAKCILWVYFSTKFDVVVVYYYVRILTFESACGCRYFVNLIGLLLCFQVRSKFAMVFHVMSK